MKSPLFEHTGIYQLGKIYKELGETMMDPKTDLRDLAALGHKYGFSVRMELVPDDDSALNGDKE